MRVEMPLGQTNGTMETMTKKIFVVLTLAAAVIGCAGKQSGLTVADLQDPKTTPEEKWSDAMHVAQAMNLPNIYDLPKNLYQRMQAPAVTTGGQQQSVTSGSVITAGTGALSGAPMSGVGVGVAAISLLTSGLGNLENRVQVAAWVPMNKASSFDEAQSIVQREWSNARSEVFPIIVSTSAHTDLALSGAFFPKSKVEWAKEKRTNALPPNLSKQIPSYGPIYIQVADELTKNIYKNKMDDADAYEALTSRLPEWFFIYSPGAPYGDKKRAPSVFNQSNEYFFIGK